MSAPRLVPDDPADRLREISRLWHVATNEGRPFLGPMSPDVPAMRALLDGYTHPDEVPE